MLEVVFTNNLKNKVMSWKVEIIVGEDKETRTAYINSEESEEEIYSTAKIWFMTNNPSIPFWEVKKVTKI